MKKILPAILPLLLMCNWAIAQEGNCDRVTHFGEVEICLPKIEGYKECYSDSIVKQLADETEVEINTVLGYYLENYTFERKDSLGLFSFDNYFKVYGTKQIKDYQADSVLLKQVQDMFTNTFLSENWELMEKEIDNIGLELEIGVPTVIKTYKLNENSFTNVMVAKYEIEGQEPFTMAMTINGLLVNERLLWMAYYLNYAGEETIARLEKGSNKILIELLNAKNGDSN